MADVGVLSSIGKEVDGDNLVRLLRYLLQNLSAENMIADPFNLTTEERACGSFDGRTLYKKLLSGKIQEDSASNVLEYGVENTKVLWADTVICKHGGVWADIKLACGYSKYAISLPNSGYDAGDPVYAIIYYVKGGNGR